MTYIGIDPGKNRRRVFPLLQSARMQRVRG